jgi:phosphoglycerate kinase
MGFVTNSDGDSRGVPVLEDLPDPAGRRVLVRATFDRPLADDPAAPLAQRRARGLASTLKWLHLNGARATVCGHAMEGPGGDRGTGGGQSGSGQSGEREHGATQRHLARIRESLEQAWPELAGAGDSVELRSASEDPSVVRRLVEGHDLFVNDTLQDSFLPVPSLTFPPAALPSAVGRTLEHDLATLDAFLLDPPRPFVVLLGGERSFDRLHGLQGLMLRADTVLLGGGLALPMLQALGTQPTDHATEAFLWECRSILGLSQRVHHQVSAPVDLVWSDAGGAVAVTSANERAGVVVGDIGPLTRIRFGEVLAGARSVLWAGALGMVEQEPFRAGTVAIAAGLPRGASVVLGGDALVTALAASHLLPRSAEMLSATDAAVELLKNGDLPALAAIRRR